MRTLLSSTELVVVILSLALATLATRSGILMAGAKFRLSHRVEAALRFAPACALTALILPEVLYPSGVLDLSFGNPRWLSTLVAVIFLIWRPSMLGGIAIGMAVYAVIRLW